jgi:hypothetical protein
VAAKLSRISASPGIESREPARTEALSWRVALSLIANASVGLWIVIGKAVLLFAF